MRPGSFTCQKFSSGASVALCTLLLQNCIAVFCQAAFSYKRAVCAVHVFLQSPCWFAEKAQVWLSGQHKLLCRQTLELCELCSRLLILTLYCRLILQAMLTLQLANDLSGLLCPFLHCIGIAVIMCAAKFSFRSAVHLSYESVGSTLQKDQHGTLPRLGPLFMTCAFDESRLCSMIDKL